MNLKTMNILAVAALIATIATNQVGWWESSDQKEVRIMVEDEAAVAALEADLTNMDEAIAALGAVLDGMGATNRALEGFSNNPSIDSMEAIMIMIDGVKHRSAKAVNAMHIGD